MAINLGEVDKSLVVPEQEQGQTRYRLLEMVRQYARDRLQERGEGESVRERHQAFFMALAEEAEPLSSLLRMVSPIPSSNATILRRV